MSNMLDEDSWQKYSPLKTSDGLGLSESKVSAASFGSNFDRKGFLPSGNRKANDHGYGIDSSIAAKRHDNLEESSFSSARFPAPQLDTPQRIGPPAGVNAPDRVPGASRDEQIRQHFGLESKKNEANGNKTKNSKYDIASYSKSTTEEKTDSHSSKKNTTNSTLHKQRNKNNNTALGKLKDYNILASACRRAGKFKQESIAHYCRGVLLDNIEKWEKAIESYKKYLALCRKCNDPEGEAVACNSCGVNYYLLAMGGVSAYSLTVGLDEANRTVDRELLAHSIHYHKLHYKLSDISGRFVALCNLGLCYTEEKDLEQASNCYQEALKIAISLNSPQGQSLAVGNLGLTAFRQGDWEAAKQCMDKHLHFTRDLQNVQAQCLACQQLGQITNKMGDYEEAAQYYEEARHIAQNAGEEGMLKLVNCNLGVTHGNIRFNQFKRTTMSNLR